MLAAHIHRYTSSLRFSGCNKWSGEHKHCPQIESSEPKSRLTAPAAMPINVKPKFRVVRLFNIRTAPSQASSPVEWRLGVRRRHVREGGLEGSGHNRRQPTPDERGSHTRYTPPPAGRAPSGVSRSPHGPITDHARATTPPGAATRCTTPDGACSARRPCRSRRCVFTMLHCQCLSNGKSISRYAGLWLDTVRPWIWRDAPTSSKASRVSRGSRIRAQDVRYGRKKPRGMYREVWRIY